MPPTRKTAAAKTAVPGEQLPPVDPDSYPPGAVDLPPAEVEEARPFMSAGVHGELETWGRAIDPATGGTFERDADTGKVTYTDRAGNVVEL